MTPLKLFILILFISLSVQYISTQTTDPILTTGIVISRTVDISEANAYTIETGTPESFSNQVTFSGNEILNNGVVTVTFTITGAGLSPGLTGELESQFRLYIRNLSGIPEECNIDVGIDVDGSEVDVTIELNNLIVPMLKVFNLLSLRVKWNL